MNSAVQLDAFAEPRLAFLHFELDQNSSLSLETATQHVHHLGGKQTPNSSGKVALGITELTRCIIVPTATAILPPGGVAAGDRICLSISTPSSRVATHRSSRALRQRKLSQTMSVLIPQPVSWVPRRFWRSQVIPPV